MLRVLKSGAQTTVQDAKGRRGYAHLGFPPSGAMDSLAITVGNILVGNNPNEGALEFAFIGPSILFQEETLISVTGAVCAPRLDGGEIPMWTAVRVRNGQTLSFDTPAASGQWGYVCVSGGIDVKLVMGSKSTFAAVKVGGLGGRYLQKDDTLPTGPAKSLHLEGRRLRGRYIPVITDPMCIELMYGYFTDYLSDDDIEKMYSSVWKIQTNSSRLGYRLTGPEFVFSDKARNKGSASGAFPSNIFDCGYPVGAINLAGQTPIILTADGPTCGGYMCPFNVASASLWKIGQCKIGSNIRFKYTDLEGAKALRKDMQRYFEADAYTI